MISMVQKLNRYKNFILQERGFKIVKSLDGACKAKDMVICLWQRNHLSVFQNIYTVTMKV